MELNINVFDVVEVKESLQKQKEDIEEKLKAISIVEKLIKTENDDTDRDEFSEDMNLTDATKSIFVRNPDREFLISEILNRLEKGGIRGNYGHTTISSTLRRLAKKGDLQVRRHKNKNKFKLKSSEE